MLPQLTVPKLNSEHEAMSLIEICVNVGDGV